MTKRDDAAVERAYELGLVDASAGTVDARRHLLSSAGERAAYERAAQGLPPTPQDRAPCRTLSALRRHVTPAPRDRQ